MADPRERLRPIGKPTGGLWTCRGPEWWLCAPVERRPHAALWALRAPAARLLLLDTPDKIGAAFARYPRDYLDAVGPLKRFAMPELDHAAIAADGYDGIEVPRPGIVHNLVMDVPMEEACLIWLPMLFAGWDVPTILWYRWAFTGPPRRVPVAPASYGLLERDEEEE